MTHQLNKPSQPTEPVDVSDAQLAKFWGADLGKLTLNQKLLIASLFQAVKQHRR